MSRFSKIGRVACVVAPLAVAGWSGSARAVGFTEPELWVDNYGYNAGGWRVERHPRTLADVDDDGLMDIVGFGNDGVFVSRSDGEQFELPELWVENFGYDAGGWRVERHVRVTADVNGDDLMDVVGFGDDGVYVARSTGEGFRNVRRWIANYAYNAGGWRIERHLRMLGDVTGDGRDDVVGFGDDGVYVSRSTGGTFRAARRWVANYAYNAGQWRVERHPRTLADVDDDGRLDIVGFGNDGVYVSLATGNGFTEPERWVANYGYNAGQWRTSRHLRLLGDVDGDGMPDIVGFGNAGVYVSLSTGTEFTEPELWVENYAYQAGQWRVERHPRMLGDVNADGMMDIVGFGNDGVYVSLSTGTEFEEPRLVVANFGYVAGGWRVERHPRMLADVDGDGLVDVVGFGNDGVYVSRSREY